MSNIRVQRFFTYDTQTHPVQPSAVLEVYDSNNINKITEARFPISDFFDLDINPGTYVFRFRVNDTITAGTISPVLSDDVTASPLFAPGAVVNSSNHEVVSGPVSITNAFNSFKCYATNNLAVTAPPAASFEVDFFLERCEGSNPVTRRAYFTFGNFEAPMQFSTDNSNFVTFNYSNFFRAAEVGTQVTYYFRDFNNQTAQVTVNFDACTTPPQAAPSLSKTSVTENENLDITFQGPATLRAYKGNTLVQSVGNITSPYTWNSANLGSGTYQFTVEDDNGESAKSVEVLVSPVGGGLGCNVPHLMDIGNWQPQGFGSYPFKGLKFSNTGQFAIFAQIISENPLVFRPRGRNLLLRDDFELANGVTESIIDCLFGDFTSQGLTPPANIPLPPGYTYDPETHNYYPSDSPIITSAEQRIRVKVLNACDVTNFQIGVTRNYSNAEPNPGEVESWVDGLEAIVTVQDGAYPWVFVRSKLDPNKISNPTKTLVSA